MIRQIESFIDRCVGFISPRWALDRMAARQVAWTLESFSGGNGPGGYNGGKLNRLTKGWSAPNLNENAVNRSQIDQLRWNSWDLFRNNPHARKICRSLEAKVIGRGLNPSSDAIRSDGSAHVEFREAVERLWKDIADEIDYRGAPGRGGQHMSDLQKTALRGVILGGDTFYSLRRKSPRVAREMGLTIPLQLQLIHAQRLAEITQDADNGNEIYHGIELNADGSRAAYWLYDRHPSEPNVTAEAKRFAASKIGHLYISDDIDQLRGSPWFAAALMQMRDTSDYQYNELKASALAACIVLGYRRASGQNRFGTVGGNGGGDLVDSAGNPITAMQPGMIMDLGSDGEIQGFNPARPSTQAGDWINHLIRSTATSVPGMKGSTLTGDYRNSSFSSEKSADNDAWPEIEGLQDWFCFNLMQPVYSEVIKTAFLSGYFKGIVTDTEFADNEKAFLAASWQGPVALSINPVDDAAAAEKRIKNGTSSPQIECAKIGKNWRKIQADVDEYAQDAASRNLPEAYVAQVLSDTPPEAPPTKEEANAAAAAA